QRDKDELERHAEQESPQELFADQQDGAHRKQFAEHNIIGQHGGDNDRQRQRCGNLNATGKSPVVQHGRELQKRQDAEKGQHQSHQRREQRLYIDSHRRLTDQRRRLVKDLDRKIHQLRQHPLTGEDQHAQGDDQSRQKAQRLFVNLRGGLKNTDAQPDNQ